MKNPNSVVQNIVIRVTATFTLTLTLVIFSRLPLATAETAPIFRQILRDIQNQIPMGMLMRLPSSIPNPPSSIPGYRPEIVSNPESGYFAIRLITSNCPQIPAPAVCDTGRILVTKLTSNNSEWLRDHKNQSSQINLNSATIAFYRSYIQPTRGLMQEIIWEQDNLIFGVMSRSMSEQQVIDIATSMANETPIYNIRQAQSSPTLTQEAIDRWTDNFFYSANPQLSRRKLRAGETEYIREWNSIQRVVPDILVYGQACTINNFDWRLENYDDQNRIEGRLFVSEALDKVADAIFYSRNPQLGYRKIQPGETTLANEWMRIRRAVSLLPPCFY